jgi:hypothetical protein
VKDGEPKIIRKNKKGQGLLIHSCCDCGLQHDMSITSDRYKFILTFWRR